MYKLPIARDRGMVAARHDDEFGWQRLLASPRAVRTADQSVAICKPCAVLKRKKTTHPLSFSPSVCFFHIKRFFLHQFAQCSSSLLRDAFQ
jgi:hypothetical protein